MHRLGLNQPDPEIQLQTQGVDAHRHTAAERIHLIPAEQPGADVMKLLQAVRAVKLHQPAADSKGLFCYSGFIVVGFVP
ncbi:hypothetical protein D3C86_1943070 [compost metagenome]